MPLKKGKPRGGGSGRRRGSKAADVSAPPQKRAKRKPPSIVSDVSVDEEVPTSSSSEEEQPTAAEAQAQDQDQDQDREQEQEQEQENLQIPAAAQTSTGNKSTRKKKGTPRQVYRIDDHLLEENILEWMQQQENDFLWNSIRTDYRCPQKKKTRFGLKEKEINDDPAYDIEMSDGFLSKWFEGLRDQYTKLHKRKSGDGSPMFTERQQWILDNLKFFNRLVTHRSKPVRSFRHVAAENAGDLEAMEAAAALEAIDVDNLSDATGPSSKKRKEKVKTEKEDKEENQRMEKKKKEADDVIATLKATMSEPHTDVTAYAQYIRMTLVRMPRPVFKKARMAINRALEPFLDSSDDSSSNEASVASMPAMKPPSHPSTRPSSAASASATTTSGFSSGACGTGSGTFSGTGLGSRPTSPCEQPLPHLWKTPPPGHRPDVWGSQSQDFINQQYGSWPQQQQQQHGQFVQQGWATPYNQQQQQQYHQVQASQSQPLRRTPTPAVSTLRASASTGDILQQATSVLNLSSSQLDTTIGSNFDTSGFLNAMDGSQEKDTSKDTPNDTPKDTSTIDTPPGHKY